MQRGFTLIEMSLVILIIGLLVGAVVAGKSMLETARLNKLGSEMQQIEAAFGTFKTKYSAFPGDLSDASSYWTGAYNGNGNSVVEPYSETMNSWVHLASAGFAFCTSCDATYWDGNWNVAIGRTYAPSAYGAGFGYDVYGISAQGIGAWSYLSPGNYLLPISVDVNTNPPNMYNFSGLELEKLDSKFDDGRPYTGKIITWNHGACTTSGAIEAYYFLSSPGTVVCMPYYKID